MDVVNNIGSKKGCLLVQFPPSVAIGSFLKANELLVKLRSLDPESTWKICVEFRHPSWYVEEVNSMLHTNGAHLVRHDLPKSATPFTTPTSSVVYQRFHGPTGNYRGDYDNAFLAEFAQYIYQWMMEGKEVFIFFNNTAGNAFNNLTSLNKFVDECVVR